MQLEERAARAARLQRLRAARAAQPLRLDPLRAADAPLAAVELLLGERARELVLAAVELAVAVADECPERAGDEWDDDHRGAGEQVMEQQKRRLSHTCSTWFARRPLRLGVAVIGKRHRGYSLGTHGCLAQRAFDEG